ncbi:hypothetical protein QYM36_002158, partial [Artemia franciscana]
KLKTHPQMMTRIFLEAHILCCLQNRKPIFLLFLLISRLIVNTMLTVLNRSRTTTGTRVCPFLGKSIRKTVEIK